MFKTYSLGCDVLGAAASEQETNRAVLIRVRNAAALARSQGGIATLAQALAPATVEAKVYDEMAKKLAEALKAQNVDAEVTVVEPKGFVSADGKHVWTDVGIGLGLAGVAAVVWHFLPSRKKAA